MAALAREMLLFAGMKNEHDMKNEHEKTQAANLLILLLVALVLVLSVARGHVVASLVGHADATASGCAATAPAPH